MSETVSISKAKLEEIFGCLERIEKILGSDRA